MNGRDFVLILYLTTNGKGEAMEQFPLHLTCIPEDITFEEHTESFSKWGNIHSTKT
jgi:hypothetical protein